MTRVIWNGVPIIEAEPPQMCSLCKMLKETRPYGTAGAEVCFDCAMNTPERQAETKRRFKEFLEGSR